MHNIKIVLTFLTSPRFQTQSICIYIHFDATCNCGFFLS